jgi:hypothetical protein
MAGPKRSRGTPHQDGFGDDLLQPGSRSQNGHKVEPVEARSVEGWSGPRACLLRRSAQAIGVYGRR